MARPSSTAQPAYLDLKALALYASCSVRWLRARLTDSKAPLPCYRVGVKILVRVEEFDRWMAGYRALPQPDGLDQIVDDVIAHVAQRNTA